MTNRRPGLIAAILAASLLLGGCDVRQRLDAAEDRINAAVPMPADIRQAHDRLAGQLASQPSELAVFDKAWRARLRARAVSCSPDFTPSWRHSDDQVKAGVSNKTCFSEFDRVLARWVGVQRVRLKLLSTSDATGNAPPSITLRGQPSSLTRDGGRSPVMAITSSDGLEMTSLATGRSVFSESGPHHEVSVSPNGQLFAQAEGSTVRLRATDGGETLLELTEARGIHWLGPEFLGVRTVGGKPSTLLSLRSAVQAPIVTSGQSSAEVLLPVPGKPNRFNALGFPGLYQYEAEERDGQLFLTLMAEKPGVDPRLAPVTSGVGQFSADGRQWVLAGGHKLVRLNLDTLEVEERGFEPALVYNAAPTASPEQFVLDLRMPGGADGMVPRSGNYLFDAPGGTLARVTGPAAQRPVRYFPAIRRLAHTGYPTMWLTERLDTAAPVPAAEVVAAMLDEANQSKLARVAAAEDPRLVPGAAAQAVPDRGGQPPADALLPGMKDAQVEGIGVYEAMEKIAQPGQSRSTGRVVVTVRRSTRPLVLVLSSYEPVQWQLRLQPGARLGAVLVAGYYDSTVLGAGNARVLKMGRVYAHEQDGAQFIALQREVTRWAGRPISLFQGGYRGGSYTVGGP